MLWSLWAKHPLEVNMFFYFNFNLLGLMVTCWSTLINAPTETESPNCNGMHWISSLTTDNWLLIVIKIQHSDWSKSVFTQECCKFCWLQPCKPRLSSLVVKMYCCANSGRICKWAMQAIYKTNIVTHVALTVCHSVVAIL